MTLCQYLNENVNSVDAIYYQLNWEDYAAGKNIIKKSDFTLFCNQVWNAINQWAFDNAENCSAKDAEFIAVFLNDTLKYTVAIVKDMKKGPYSPELTPCFSQVYARCFYFTEHPCCGNELFRKCQLAVNKFMANASWGIYQKMTISDILECDNEKNPLESM